MRSPVLIAETPFAGGHGPRFLAPPGRGVDVDTAARYVGRAREVEDDVEEIEGDDFLAVRLARTDEATGHTAPETLVLAGIDVDRMGGDDRDEVLEQLRERLEVLADAVAAVDWPAAGHSPVVEIPELEEWHEAGWDVFPRAGQWADPSGDQPTEPFRGVAEDDPPGEPPASAGGYTETGPWTSQSDESVEDAGDPFRFGPESEPVTGHTESSAAATPEPALPDPSPEPVPDVIVPAREPTAPAPAPPPEPVTAPALRLDPAPAPVSRPAHAKNVSESVDRSPALALPPAPSAAAPPRRWWPRWYVWVPWTAVAVLLTAKYLYLTEIDRTWNQRITETTYVPGPTRVIETVVEKPVERVVERPVEKVVTLPAAPAADNSKDDQWARFASDYRTGLGRGEVFRAADLLAAWKVHLPAWGSTAPPGLTDLQAEFRTFGPNKLRDWAAGRAADHRFADAYAGLAAFAAAEPVKALLGPTAPAELARQARADVRAAEDQYHYTQLRTLAAADPVPEDRLTQHINAYLALVEPPGRMLAEVQALAEYRKWLKAGRPAEAVVRVEWGPRTPAREHTIEIALGAGADGKPLKTVTRTVTAEPGGSWSETVALEGVTAGADGVVPYRVKTVRPTSPVEELAEGARTRTELFLLDAGRPLTAADEPESGTKVAVEWRGLVARPAVPAWKSDPSPVVPVSLPKVGQ
jgi:hypothetical protein